MYKRVIYLLSFILMLAGSAWVPVCQADLISYWPLDSLDANGQFPDAVGTNPGTPSGGTAVDTAVKQIGAGSAHFTGTGEIQMAQGVLSFVGESAMTIAAWINPENTSGTKGIFSRTTGNNACYNLRIDGSKLRIGFYTDGGWNISASDSEDVQAGVWTHVAAVYDGSSATRYINGNVSGAVMNTSGSTLAQQGTAQTAAIGNRAAGSNQNFVGNIDEVIVYNHALTQAEIQKIMRGLRGPGSASGPNPMDEATDVPRDVTLSWSPGEFANTHNVYLGTIFDDVNHAALADAVSVGQIGTTYDPTTRLDFGQTYYWRIDEVNAPPDETVFKGDVWSFTVEPFAYPIDVNRITASASSSNKPEEGPENTINGAGLGDDDLHSIESRDMWLSSLTGAQPTWIQYEFARVHKLYQMLVWNYNTTVEPAIGFGVKEATIEYSTDGSNWTTLGTTHEFVRGPGAEGYAANTTVDLGSVAAKYVRITANSNWGGFVNQYGLSEVRFSYIPVLAREPDPVSGATDIAVDAALSWRPGHEASTHKVCLSTDQQAVIDGTAPVVTVASPSYAPSLDLAGTYYWRIDEVNEAETPTAWQGDIWSFSTQEYLVVEDFEAYNDIPSGQEGSHLVYDTWADGYASPTTNGSTMGYTEAFQPSMEAATVYDGKQSVPLFYNNTTASVSEVTANVADLQAGKDWTRYGIKGLTLRFSGDPNNVPQQMYAKVNGAKVLYDVDAENLKFRGWQMWYIDLASLGVNLSNVSTLTIGLERIAGAGGQGMILLDGIRLYSYERPLVTPVAPDRANLVGHWTFDDGAGTTAADSSEKKNNGTITGAQWVAGHVGGALKFNGAEYVQIPPTAWSSIDMQLTVAFWAFGDDALGNNWGFYAGDSAGRLAGCHIPWNGSVIFDTTSGWERIQRVASADEVRGRWHHWAFVKNADSGDKEIYLDGKLWHSGNGFTTPIADVTEFNIGAGSGGVRPYVGLIDDFQLYDCALSPEEVAGLAGLTVPFDKPF